MATLVVRHELENYETWRQGFNAHEVVRKEHGCTATRVVQDAVEPSIYTVVMEFPSVAAAQGFGADPSLQEAMASAGLVGAPRIELYVDAES